jgi:3,4-dihydroxy-2-butanone 4-phosphate synthase
LWLQDDYGRENEGDLILPAAMASKEALAFVVRHGTGIVCVAIPDERCKALELPPMTAVNADPKGTAFTVSCDLSPMHGISTGVSAADRAKTIAALASPATKPEDLNRPGHIFPLRSKAGGVLQRNGHTEAAVDLARLAGHEPAGLLCEIVRDDGDMARLDDCRLLAEANNLPLISVADLQRYRCANEPVVAIRSGRITVDTQDPEEEWITATRTLSPGELPSWTQVPASAAGSSPITHEALLARASTVAMLLQCPQAPDITLTLRVDLRSGATTDSTTIVLGPLPKFTAIAGSQAWFDGPHELLVADSETQPSAYDTEEPTRQLTATGPTGDTVRLSSLATAMLQQAAALLHLGSTR